VSLYHCLTHLVSARSSEVLDDHWEFACALEWVFEQCFSSSFWMIYCSAVSEHDAYVHSLWQRCCVISFLFSFFNTYHLLNVNFSVSTVIWMSINMWFCIVAQWFIESQNWTNFLIASETKMRSITLCWVSLFQVSSSHGVSNDRSLIMMMICRCSDCASQMIWEFS